ncbi:hypothetical protein Tco_0522953 [Tanacetum coccineum]
MNYHEEKSDGEAMIYSITHGKQPLLVVTQVSFDGTAPNAPLKCGYKKDNCELNYNFLNNLKPEWKQYGTLMMKTNNLMDINNDDLYNILKQNQGDVNDAIGYKKKAVVITSDLLALVAEKKKTSSSSISAKKKPKYVKSKEKKYDGKKRDMRKPKMLLAKKGSDEQVLLVEDQAWMESSSDSNQELSVNMVFMAKMEKILSDSEESSSSAEETIVEVSYYSFNSEKTFHDAIKSASENVDENHIVSQKNHDELEVDHNEFEDKDHLVNKLIAKCYLLNDYDDVGKLKENWDIEMFVGYSKESTAFRIYNKRPRKIHESINVNFDEISEMASKQFSLEPGLSNLNETEKPLNPTVSQVLETSKKDLEDLFHDFYDEYFDSSKIKKSPTTNVKTSNKEISPSKEEVFHVISELFQEESSSSSLNNEVQQSSEEVTVPSSNTQSVSNKIVPNVNESSTSHNVFNERLEDAYFDPNMRFHDPSNVHTFYQPN